MPKGNPAFYKAMSKAAGEKRLRSFAEHSPQSKAMKAVEKRVSGKAPTTLNMMDLVGRGMRRKRLDDLDRRYKRLKREGKTKEAERVRSLIEELL